MKQVHALTGPTAIESIPDGHGGWVNPEAIAIHPTAVRHVYFAPGAIVEPNRPTIHHRFVFLDRTALTLAGIVSETEPNPTRPAVPSTHTLGGQVSTLVPTSLPGDCRFDGDGNPVPLGTNAGGVQGFVQRAQLTGGYRAGDRVVLGPGISPDELER